MQVQRLEGARVVATDHRSQERLLLLELQVLHLGLEVVEGWGFAGFGLPRLLLLPEAILNKLAASVQDLLLQNL